jgi:hypothetical protein
MQVLWNELRDPFYFWTNQKASKESMSNTTMKEITIHRLKTWVGYFEEVKAGTKKFEVRVDDRAYEVGDQLLLRDWDPEKKKYTGEELLVKVTYILDGGMFGVEKGYVVMSIEPVKIKKQNGNSRATKTSDKSKS